MAKEKSFDAVMQELESIVEKLEKADIPLEEAVDYYQKGIELSKWCDERLKHVEDKVVSLIDENNNKVPLDDEEA